MRFVASLACEKRRAGKKNPAAYNKKAIMLVNGGGERVMTAWGQLHTVRSL